MFVGRGIPHALWGLDGGSCCSPPRPMASRYRPVETRVGIFSRIGNLGDRVYSLLPAFLGIIFRRAELMYSPFPVRRPPRDLHGPSRGNSGESLENLAIRSFEGKTCELTDPTHHRQSSGATITIVLATLALLFVAMPASAAVTTGLTTPLVASGQPVRESSTAVPVFAINATSTTGTDDLVGITISFSGTGFVSGNAGTLLVLNRNPATSGVALYEDNGSTGFALDAGDAGVTAVSAVWSGSSVILTYTEPVPTSLSGRFGWILVIRTSANVANGNQIIAQIAPGGITFSGTASQPATPITSNALTVSLTAVNDLLATAPWIGPSSVSVNTRAVLSIRLVDGGIPVNYGIHDQFHRVVVQLFDNSGTFGPNTFATLTSNPATSGMSLYADTNGNGVWDAGDTGVPIVATPTINCVGPTGGALFDVCIFPNTAYLPHSLIPPAVSYFVVVRSGTAMASGDDFTFQILLSNGLWISGISPGDATRFAGTADVLSSSLLGDNTAPCILGFCGSPVEPHWENPTSSPYLFPRGRTLYFSHGMGASGVPGEVRIAAEDGESGLSVATFSAAASLAGSPAAQTLSGTGVFVNVYGNYTFSPTSTGASSPVTVTAFDAVGNRASLTFFFVLDTTPPTITPAPGWTNLPGGEPFYVNASGALWFSPWISGTARVDISQDLFDATAGLRNATSTVEPSLAGGPFYVDPTSFPAGTHLFAGWTVEYAFTSASTAAASPASVMACDNVGNCASAPYAYVLDATVPQVTILSPANGATVSTSIIVAATATDSGSGIAPPLQIGLLNSAGTYVFGFADMFWNGTAWRYPIQTALFPDGAYRIVVEAFDNVGNIGASVVDVTLHNSALDTTPPSLVVTGPTPYAYLTGTVAVNVSSTDAGGFGTTGGVWAQLGAYAPVALSLSGGVWTGSLATSGVPGGSYTLTVWSTDAAGNTARTSFPVTVDNTPPALVFVAPGSGALVSGIKAMQVSALDTVGVATVTLSVGGSTYTMGSVGSGVYAYDLDTTALTTGSVTLTVTATDLAGLSTSKTLSISVDNTPPSVTLGSPSSDRGAITLTATVSDSPAGLASVVFVVDGKTYTGVATATGTYAVTIWTTQADNGAHSYEVIATDHAGNSAMTSGVFSVNNPANYYASFLAFAPLGIFFVLLVALILGLMLLRRRGRRPREPDMAERTATPKQGDRPEVPEEL